MGDSMLKGKGLWLLRLFFDFSRKDQLAFQKRRVVVGDDSKFVFFFQNHGRPDPDLRKSARFFKGKFLYQILLQSDAVLAPRAHQAEGLLRSAKSGSKLHESLIDHRRVTELRQCIRSFLQIPTGFRCPPVDLESKDSLKDPNDIPIEDADFFTKRQGRDGS